MQPDSTVLKNVVALLRVASKQIPLNNVPASDQSIRFDSPVFENSASRAMLDDPAVVDPTNVSPSFPGDYSPATEAAAARHLHLFANGNHGCSISSTMPGGALQPANADMLRQGTLVRVDFRIVVVTNPLDQKRYGKLIPCDIVILDQEAAAMAPLAADESPRKRSRLIL